MSLKYYEHSTPFVLESGEKIDHLKIAYKTYGEYDNNQSNVVWVFHALTASADVFDWWHGLFGNDDNFNPRQHFIVCANVIGSPYGSSSPDDMNFPQITVRDVVNAHLLLAKHLNIKNIYVAIGGSFGGSQALEFAFSYQYNIENLILISCAAKESAWGIAIHEAQRMALLADDTFGTSGGGVNGLKAARSIAMLTYRSPDCFISQQNDNDDRMDDFRSASYIRYQGEKFVKRFDAHSYYFLTKTLDTHNIGRERGGTEKALARINIRSLVIGISSDTLLPSKLQKEIASGLPNSQYQEIDSIYGHDGFLTETQKITKIIKKFLFKEIIKKKHQVYFKNI